MFSQVSVILLRGGWMGGYVSSDDHQVSLAREVGMSREGFMSRGNREYVQRGRVYHGVAR